MPGLTGEVLVDVVRRKGATAGSLDGWGWRELKVLPVAWFHGLARILAKVEENGVWPEGAGCLFAMIPKGDGDATPLGQRPLSVLPVVYRVVQLEGWFRSWVLMLSSVLEVVAVLLRPGMPLLLTLRRKVWVLVPFFHAASGIHRCLSDFIHAVVVCRRDEAVRGWRKWIREDAMVHPYRWLRPDLVPPAPFLQCKPDLTPGGSGVLADPAGIDEEFRKAWLSYFCRSGQREVSLEEFNDEVEGWLPLLVSLCLI